MSGTTAGGLKAATSNKSRHGKDFYRTIGRAGGTKSRGGGFSGNPELARRAGAIGGRRSRRGSKGSMAAAAFFIEDATIEQHIIEPFNKQPFYRGWFKRSK